MERASLPASRSRLSLARATLPPQKPELPDLYGFNQPPIVTTKANLLSSGCMLLDNVNGGGYREGRIINIVGDKSTGKTLLAIEAATNFLEKYPNGLVRYRETESAFDREYAHALGLPMSNVEFVRAFTVEEMFKDHEDYMKKCNRPTLDITDSVDALSDAAELDRGIDEGTFGGNKPKKIGEMFRRLVQKWEDHNITVILISQTRDKIGAMFGDKQTRSGGRALDFYASQIFWLSHIGQIKKTKGGVERVIGVNVKAKNKKNKIGPPFRDCEFPIYFSYGVDDVEAALNWLKEVKQEKVLGTSSKEYYSWMSTLSPGDYHIARKQLVEVVAGVWAEIESRFAPTRRKYQ